MNQVANPSPRQAVLLEFIKNFCRENGYPPTIRSMTLALGINSPTGIMSHLKPLVKKGFLTKSYNNKSAKYMPVVPAGHCLCCGQRRPEE